MPARPYLVRVSHGAPMEEASFLLAFWPERVDGPQGLPHEMALALIAAKGQNLACHDKNPAAAARRNDWESGLGSSVYGPTWTFPPGSYAVFSEQLPEGPRLAKGQGFSPDASFAVRVPPKDRKLPPIQQTRREAVFETHTAAEPFSKRWDDAHAFFLPHVYRGLGPTTWDQFGTSFWWDSVGAGMIVGAINAYGVLPYAKVSFWADLPAVWMYAVLGAAARAMKPWMGDPAIRPRGHGSREYPLTAATPRVIAESVKMLGRKDTSQDFPTHGWLLGMIGARMIAPNAPYAPTAWVLGPRWQDALDRFPQAILDAGAAAADVVPLALEDVTPEQALYATLPVGATTHAGLRRRAMIARIDATVAKTAPEFARARRTLSTGAVPA